MTATKIMYRDLIGKIFWQCECASDRWGSPDHRPRSCIIWPDGG